MILLDTHVLVWWVNKDVLLPTSILRFIQQQDEKQICISAITFWEVALLTKKKKVNLAFDLHSWTQLVLSIPSLRVIDLNPAILIKSVLLEAPLHADPADRIIVATTQTLGATLISKDDKLLKYPHIKTFWKE